MNKRYEQLLDQQAKKSRYMFRLGALIINDNRIIAAGYNRIYNTGVNTHTSDCAEILALKKTPRTLRKNSIVVVARKRKSGTYGMAKPCSKCQNALRKAGIKTAYFTTPDGWKKMEI